MPDTDYDFLIAGYGPVGAVLANLLGRRGYRVCVVDRMADIYDTPRAISFDHETMRAMQACGVADAVAAIIEPHPGARYVGVQGQPIKLLLHLPAPYPLGWHPSYTFVQPKFEEVLRAGVCRLNTVTTILSTEIVDVAQVDDRVVADLRGPDGSFSSISAKYALACDGASSSIRKLLGIPLQDLDFDEPWLVIDTLVDDPADFPDICIQYCQPAHPGSFVFGPGRLRRWEIKLLPHERREDFIDHESVVKRLEDFADVSKLSIWRHATYQFHAVVAERWRAGRIFLVGDSAHQTAPFLAQGLCSGIRDAFNLFWKLDLVLSGRAPDALLDTYGAERKPHMAAIATLTKSLGKVIGELDPLRAARRDTEMEQQYLDPATDIYRQNLFPTLTAGLLDCDNAGRPVRKAGHLCVQPWLLGSNGPALLDDRYGATFLILCRPEAGPVGQSARQLMAAVGGQVVVIASADEPSSCAVDAVEVDGLFRDFCQHIACQYVVKRPDGYIYGTASNVEELDVLCAKLGKALDCPTRSAA